ncbi:Uncharacterized protein DAT39_016996 [Clarias magur]|uniref:Uncharacterized protein n=1 Tax=Clarias magur TaxID=1594786 RepID=A0A8J4TWH8_CLAMG|nr:Uncharacterized protein DAT39_016996 [Clarias magur]
MRRIGPTRDRKEHETKDKEQWRGGTSGKREGTEMERGRGKSTRQCGILEVVVV